MGLGCVVREWRREVQQPDTQWRMSEKESQAHELVRRKEWVKAMELYDQVLSTNTFKTPKERTVACLFGRSECGAELCKYESVIGDCRRLLKMLTELDTLSTVAYVRRRLIVALCHMKRYHEADAACKEWLGATTPNGAASSNGEFVKILDRYRTVIQMANGQKTPANQRVPQQRLDDEIAELDEKLEALVAAQLPPDRISKLISTAKSSDSISVSSNSSSSSSLSSSASSNKPPDNCNSPKDSPGEKQMEQQIGEMDLNNDTPTNEKGDNNLAIVCTYCAISFNDRTELRAHCQTESHQNVIMSDEGKISLKIPFILT